ncbi:hypothetical protein EH5_01750 [Bacillus subtilis]|nr:hypothetical protein EH5_01750 [Bacillus subtilis]
MLEGSAYDVFLLLELVVFFLAVLVLLVLIFPPSDFNSFSMAALT